MPISAVPMGEIPPDTGEDQQKDQHTIIKPDQFIIEGRGILSVVFTYCVIFK